LRTDEPDENEDQITDKDKAALHAALSGHSTMFPQDEIESQQAANEIMSRAQTIPELDQQQLAVLSTITQLLMEAGSEHVNVKELIDNTVENMLTPWVITVQKKFVSPQISTNRLDTIAATMLMWTEVLKLLVRRMKSVGMRVRGKEFVPGVVFSDEALGLYYPKNPKMNLAYDSVQINPVSIAALVDPESFNKKIYGTEMEEKQSVKDTQYVAKNTSYMPINRVTDFVYQTGVHELVHLLFPDYGSSLDEFHEHISLAEMVCAPIKTDIRNIVKKYMPELRRQSNKMIRAVGKDIKRSRRGRGE
jgi:hypothetical protein